MLPIMWHHSIEVGIATVLAADAHFQVRAGLAAIVDGHLHQLAHAFAVEGLERVLRQDALSAT